MQGYYWSQESKLSNSLSTINKLEDFEDFIHRDIGFQIIPLACVTREGGIVTAVDPNLYNNQTYYIIAWISGRFYGWKSITLSLIVLLW